MSLAGVECTCCGAEKITIGISGSEGYAAIHVCRYCDFLLCIFCDNEAPAKYLDGQKCVNCGKRHPKVG